MIVGVGGVFLVAASFLASTVEMVEALTIVLAVGISRGWRSTWLGILSALVSLAAIVALLGPALTLMPIQWLRLVVGGLLLVFGLQWLRKAILRASGYKALHDEETIYREQMAAAQSVRGGVRARMDPYAFTLAFKGVFLEGLEVVFIVLTFGGSQHNVPLAAIGAAAAVILISAVGLFVRKPLSQVPENTMKFGVGVMLTTFGLFWGGEGVGVIWPGADAAIVALLALSLGFSLICVSVLKRRRARQTGVQAKAVATA